MYLFTGLEEKDISRPQEVNSDRGISCGNYTRIEKIDTHGAFPSLLLKMKTVIITDCLLCQEVEQTGEVWLV